MQETPNRIPLSECRHGGLYRIDARNFSLGVFNEHLQGFIGIREKFFDYFLFTEYHWDTGAPYGTVSPLEFLEMCPHNPMEQIVAPATQEDVDRQISPKIKVGEVIRRENKALFDWLEEKAGQYGQEENFENP